MAEQDGAKDKGIAKDPADYYIESAEGGNADAQCRLGLAHENGEMGLERNRERALSFYKQAADQGQTDALERLCDLYENDGWTDEINSTYEHAANQGIKKAQTKLKTRETERKTQQAVLEAEPDYRRGVELEPTNPKKAFEHYKKAADKGHPEALYKTALMIRNCPEIPEPYVWWARTREEASEGYLLRANTPAALYTLGTWVEQRDDIRAFEFYTRAAEKGDANAQCRLGEIFHSKSQFKKSLQYYNDAAREDANRKGNADAQYQLAVYREKGSELMPRSEREAIDWYEKAAQNGNADAQYRLGSAYEYGELGKKPNLTDAKSWYTKAAAQGNRDAQTRLDALQEK